MTADSARLLVLYSYIRLTYIATKSFGLNVVLLSPLILPLARILRVENILCSSSECFFQCCMWSEKALWTNTFVSLQKWPERLTCIHTAFWYISLNYFKGHLEVFTERKQNLP